MKRFENLGKKLSRDEMKKVMGGSCSCTCSGSHNGDSWTYDHGGQPPLAILTNDVNSYCGTNGGDGATCVGCTNER